MKAEGVAGDQLGGRPKTEALVALVRQPSATL